MVTGQVSRFLYVQEGDNPAYHFFDALNIHPGGQRVLVIPDPSGITKPYGGINAVLAWDNLINEIGEPLPKQEIVFSDDELGGVDQKSISLSTLKRLERQLDRLVLPADTSAELIEYTSKDSSERLNAVYFKEEQVLLMLRPKTVNGKTEYCPRVFYGEVAVENYASLNRRDPIKADIRIPQSLLEWLVESPLELHGNRSEILIPDIDLNLMIMMLLNTDISKKKDLVLSRYE